ncbi:hypothetical protein EJ04DRAFT_580838 [Polyplosphaeria fusca]|uniref:Uncharacterized protein n=1 Tax=Polyplosphaeria fusca TaxID=682080 RepID=A0A9P4UXM4_9PLEO|nr:hypothetical protein EJ04DRAFT_580838 [Polyplosphaeria fusca]
MLQELARLSNVKLCVSSRPWNVFEDALGQTLDAKIKHPAFEASEHDKGHYKHITAKIIERAQGVSLLVFLVVRSLLEGMSNGDMLSLSRRIPADLRQFFRYMLDSLDPIHNQHVAHFFLLALVSQEPIPLMMYSFFEDEFSNKW